MAGKTLHFILISFWTISLATFAQSQNQFTFNGFKEAKLHLDGGATIHPNGLLQLTNTSKQLTAHAFYPTPLKFNSSLSFSLTFAFAMYPEIASISGHGIVFVISPSTDFRQGVAGKYFGLFNATSNGQSSNHIFAVELDTIQDIEFKDIDSNHVGIDVNNLISNASASAGYFSDTERGNKILNLLSAKPMQVWIEYDDKKKVVQVTMAPLGISRPSRPLLTASVDLSEVLLDSMYVGFSSSTGSVASSHYVLGWSFSHGGHLQAQGLDISKLPKLPRFGKKGKLGVGSLILIIIISAVVVLMVLAFYMIRRKKYEEVLEDWEQEYLLQRFSYKDLYNATKGFKDRELLGFGGFGKVYKGILSSTKAEVAVKKVSHGSGQGMREFVAEIACLGRLRHRNLVQLLGYCRRKGELLLVYDYMPNGSLDKYLYNHGKANLSWSERFKIIKGVASALLYLHEEWEQVVVHRDVKASNVLLDSDLNARLGDFGLARLYDHGTNPQTTHVVGTVGYLAPELTRRGKASTATDVFSFGILVLEVICARSPIIVLGGSSEEKYLVDWVYEFWKIGRIIEASDPTLAGDYVEEEVELALKVGMLCAHPRPEARPSMRQVVQFLEGDCTLPGAFPGDVEMAMFSSVNRLNQAQAQATSFHVSSSGASAFSSCSTDSILKVGR